MDLIRRCQAGDEQAFAELFHRYKNLVYKTAYLMLGDADEAEDVLQEVFVQVYKSLDAFSLQDRGQVGQPQRRGDTVSSHQFPDLFRRLDE